jgi:hypothetical protein
MEAFKEGGHLWGTVLVIAGLPIFLSAFAWKWVRSSLGPRIANPIVSIATDPRWWLVNILFVLLSLRVAAPMIE